MQRSESDILQLAEKFDCPGSAESFMPISTGHINDTYKVVFKTQNGSADYLLQKINTEVFTDPEGLMDNIVRVTGHLKSRGHNSLVVISTAEGDRYLRQSGECWRMYGYIADGITYDNDISMQQIQEASRAFGEFLGQLKDLKGPPLNETIPDFHNGRSRLESFERALMSDSAGRAADCAAEINFIRVNKDVLSAPYELKESGRVPVRTCHNDTKLNNVILHKESGKALCVIDLDTVMPGLLLYDFGDIVRTAVSNAAEDEKDPALIKADLERFRRIARGFLEGIGDKITDRERASLVTGALYMPLLIGLRFLTDHLAGDIYYKLDYPGHNLDRARSQFTLFQSLKASESELESIIFI